MRRARGLGAPSRPVLSRPFPSRCPEEPPPARPRGQCSAPQPALCSAPACGRARGGALPGWAGASRGSGGRRNARNAPGRSPPASRSRRAPEHLPGGLPARLRRAQVRGSRHLPAMRSVLDSAPPPSSRGLCFPRQVELLLETCWGSGEVGPAWCRSAASPSPCGCRVWEIAVGAWTPLVVS